MWEVGGRFPLLVFLLLVFFSAKEIRLLDSLRQNELQNDRSHGNLGVASI